MRHRIERKIECLGGDNLADGAYEMPVKRELSTWVTGFQFSDCLIDSSDGNRECNSSF